MLAKNTKIKTSGLKLILKKLDYQVAVSVKRTDSIYLSEQSAIQHEIDILIDKLPTEKDKDNLYILLNEQGTK